MYGGGPPSDGGYGRPPSDGGYGGPPPGYGAPPSDGGYGGPPPGYGAPPSDGGYGGGPPPGYGAPPSDGGYGGGPPPGYGAPPSDGGYGGQMMDPQGQGQVTPGRYPPPGGPAYEGETGVIGYPAYGQRYPQMEGQAAQPPYTGQRDIVPQGQGPTETQANYQGLREPEPPYQPGMDYPGQGPPSDYGGGYGQPGQGGPMVQFQGESQTPGRQYPPPGQDPPLSPKALAMGRELGDPSPHADVPISKYSQDVLDKAGGLRNPDILLKVVAEELRMHDKYQRGIVATSSFARVVQDLGFDFQGPETDMILKYCTVTNDGFVHYKTLMQHVAPKHTAAGTSIGQALAPPTEEQVNLTQLQQDAQRVNSMGPTEKRQFLLDRTEAIRKIYSEWDRGSIDNNGFKRKLTQIGLPLTEELHRIIDLHSSSRALSFGKVIQALQMGDFMLHKARDPEPLTAFVPHPDMQRSNIAPRNPVNWLNVDNAPRGERTKDIMPIDDGSLQQYYREAQYGDQLAALKASICEFMVGAIPSVEFVAQLDRMGVPMTLELQRLMRQQQTDNRATFRDYVKAIFPHRKEGGSHEAPGMLSYLAGQCQRRSKTLEAMGHYDKDDRESEREALKAAKAVEDGRDNMHGGGSQFAMHGDPNLLHDGTQGRDGQSNNGEGGQDGQGDWMLPSNKSPMRRSRKVYGGYGDIIAWNDTPEPMQIQDPNKVQRDFQSNPSIISHAEPAVNDERTQGRRVYGNNPRPTPFGTDADIGKHGEIYPSTSQLRRGYKGYDKGHKW